MDPLTGVIVYSRASFCRVIESTTGFIHFPCGIFYFPWHRHHIRDQRSSYLGKCSPCQPSCSALRQRGMQCLRILATSPTGSPERSPCRLEPCHAASPGLCRSASDLERNHRTLFKDFTFQQFIIHKRQASIDVVSIRVILPF